MEWRNLTPTSNEAMPINNWKEAGWSTGSGQQWTI